MARVQQIGLSEISFIFLSLWLCFTLFKRWRRNAHTTPLNGPPSPSFFFGINRIINEAEESAVLYENWESTYGPAYELPGGFGTKRIIICDPKANSHFYSKETYTYLQTKLARDFIENLFGRGLLWAEGDSHKRQRKALSPAFSNAAIRKLTYVFYDSAYKAKSAWDTMLDSSPEGTLIDVQKWMNHISLDSIGIAGFGHDFRSLDGIRSPVVDVFESLGTNDMGIFSHVVFLLGPVLPVLLNLPTARNNNMKRLRKTLSDIANELLERMRQEKEGKVEVRSEEKSIIGLLIKAESSTTELQMSQEEVLAQNVLLLAGYETTSISLTWALIELSRKPEKQQKLREELSQFTDAADPTYEQLTTGLPYLDSVVHEILRLHPPVGATTRVAAEDDVIPFNTPVTTRSGTPVSSIAIAKGTSVTSPIRYINQSAQFWGPRAREFEPERWLDEEAVEATAALGGHRHIMTFSDGPRICLGKGIALTEFKAALSVLIRNYTFELPDGPETKIVKHSSILPRPKVAGQVGANVPLMVRRVE